MKALVLVRDGILEYKDGPVPDRTGSWWAPQADLLAPPEGVSLRDAAVMGRGENVATAVFAP